MFTEKTPTPRPLSQGSRNEDAEFKGWQKTGSGEVFPLYNITAAGHPARGSTVTGTTLHKLNLRVPDAPLPLTPREKL
jgi:hypothetical protein